ncbi:MAG: A/G-specific adenine glycosylase [Planctomycetaceae bacterium]|nr:A/G-specific adenine glycosylase [Planctomycetaceae bacterium]
MSDWDASRIRRLRSAVLRWYQMHGRVLPWRASSDPYRIWISEIMLQQTTVAAVVPYFDRFVASFPDVFSLAHAREADVLKLWEGLGYYSRARNIHRAAQLLVGDYAGEFPQDVAELQQLPGIGRYTAGAIASFAFGKAAPIVEANTLRLYSRLLGLTIDPRSTAGQTQLWDFAGQIVAPKQPASFNQAVMDLGATLCRTADPDCPRCPLKSCCDAFQQGQQDVIPALSSRTAMTDVCEASVAILKGGQVLLRQRSEKERWAGMWDFARFEIPPSLADQLPAPSYAAAARAASQKRNGTARSLFDAADEVSAVPLPPEMIVGLEERTGLKLMNYEAVAEIRHVVTRYRIRLICLKTQSRGGRVRRDSGFEWKKLTDLQELPLSKTARQMADLLLASPSKPKSPVRR